MTPLTSYPVWDAPIRWFHWINALCVFALAGIGLVILNDDALGLSNDGKVLLKTLHVWIGYIFVLNLCFRFVWAFAGNHYARWRQMLPGGAGYIQRLRRYVSASVDGRPEQYLGHNPLARLGVAALLLLMTVQALTGLVLAGTDIYFPPFGHWIAAWVAAPGVDPASLAPYSPQMIDKAAYADMRALRATFATVHVYSFYLLVIIIVIHLAGVVVTELREGGGLISAMFTGRKVIAGKPVDEPPA